MKGLVRGDEVFATGVVLENYELYEKAKIEDALRKKIRRQHRFTCNCPRGLE